MITKNTLSMVVHDCVDDDGEGGTTVIGGGVLSLNNLLRDINVVSSSWFAWLDRRTAILYSKLY